MDQTNEQISPCNLSSNGVIPVRTYIPAHALLCIWRIIRISNVMVCPVFPHCLSLMCTHMIKDQPINRQGIKNLDSCGRIKTQSLQLLLCLPSSPFYCLLLWEKSFICSLLQPSRLLWRVKIIHRVDCDSVVQKIKYFCVIPDSDFCTIKTRQSVHVKYTVNTVEVLNIPYKKVYVSEGKSWKEHEDWLIDLSLQL